jgi:RNA-directed DNA polymerase
VDKVRFEDIEASGVEEWPAGLRKELRRETYRPQPVRRVMIPKPGGGERPLGIPTIRDRVAQTAAKLVLGPIFEADLSSRASGYRPGRSAQDAVAEVHQAAKPSSKSVRRLKDKVREQLGPGNKDPLPDVVRALNRLLGGWAGYFSHGKAAPP